MDGLHSQRPFVGRLDLPGQELLDGSEDRAVGGQFEGVLGPGAGLFAGAEEAQGFEGQEIVECRPIGIGHGALDEEVVVLGDGDFLQLGRIGQGGLELLADLGQNPWEVPGEDVVAGRSGRGRALYEAPAVLLEILPVPVGEDGVHYRPHFLGRLGNLGLQAGDLLLRFVSLDGAFLGDLHADGFDRLGIGLVLDGRGDDRIQFLNGCFGQSFLDRLIDFFPRSVSGSRPAWRQEPQAEQTQKKDHQSPCHDSFLLDFWPNAVLGASVFPLGASARQQTIRDRRRFATVFVLRGGKARRTGRSEKN